jgi:hypothetical protein
MSMRTGQLLLFFRLQPGAAGLNRQSAQYSIRALRLVGIQVAQQIQAGLQTSDRCIAPSASEVNLSRCALTDTNFIQHLQLSGCSKSALRQVIGFVEPIL